MEYTVNNTCDIPSHVVTKLCVTHSNFHKYMQLIETNGSNSQALVFKNGKAQCNGAAKKDDNKTAVSKPEAVLTTTNRRSKSSEGVTFANTEKRKTLYP